MPAATLTLGPWPKGLNLTSNRGLSVFLDNDELGEALNVVLTKEGFVAPRPGCKVVTSSILYEHVTGDGVMKVLGSVRLPDSSVCSFVQVYQAGTAYVYKVFSPTSIFLYFTAVGVRFTHVLLHKGFLDHEGIIFFASETNKSYKTDDFTAVATPVPIITGNVPGSDRGHIVKDRLFLVKGDESKFMWSPATKILDWTAVDNPDTVGTDTAGHEYIERTTPDDGIMAMEFFNNSFYIFKKSKTYVFTYQAVPVDDGSLRKISNEFGAYSSTIYREAIVIFSNRGVFRVDGTDFIDMQSNLNLRFEIPIDHNAIKPDDIFVTDFNNDILIGYQDLTSPKGRPELLWDDMWDDGWQSYVYGESSKYYYSMNGYTGGWTKWDYDYNREGLWETIAAPGSRYFLGQEPAQIYQAMLFTTFDKKSLVYMDWKPIITTDGSGTFHLDSNTVNKTIHEKYYIPEVSIKTRASIGGSMVNYKKIYRTFIRFYLSDQPVPNQSYRDQWIGHDSPPPATDTWTDVWTAFPQGLWTASINYNDYRFSVDQGNDGNYLFYLYPTAAGKSLVGAGSTVSVQPTAQSVNTNVYYRAYQLPIPQQRAVEFVFELKRRWSTTVEHLMNPDADRAIKQGYYFMLTGLWFDYSDKAGI